MFRYRAACAHPYSIFLYPRNIALQYVRPPFPTHCHDSCSQHLLNAFSRFSHKRLPEPSFSSLLSRGTSHQVKRSTPTLFLCLKADTSSRVAKLVAAAAASSSGTTSTHYASTCQCFTARYITRDALFDRSSKSPARQPQYKAENGLCCSTSFQGKQLLLITSDSFALSRFSQCRACCDVPALDYPCRGSQTRSNRGSAVDSYIGA